MQVRSKLIAVTGGASGIGRGLVEGLLNRGAYVAAIDMNQEALDALKDEMPHASRLSTHVCNITELDTVGALPEAIIQAQGRALDGLINNAGIIQPFASVLDIDIAAIDRVMKVNFYGTVYMTKAWLPHLLKRPEAHLVNVSSMGGFIPIPMQTVYGASKAAVKLFTEGLFSELMETSVHVSVVFPGATKTGIVDNSGIEVAADEQEAIEVEQMSPEDVASHIINGMERNAYHIPIGKDTKAMYYLHRLAPKRAARIIYNQMSSYMNADAFRTK